MHKPAGRDIPYAHALYVRILDAVLVDGKPLGSLLVDNRYNLWDSFAHIAYFDDCVRFSETKRFASVEHAYREAHAGSFSGSAFAVGLMLWAGTMLAVLLARLLGKRVLIFSVDKDSAETFRADFRIEKVYEYLHSRQISYCEFFHTLMQSSALTRLLRRGRSALYLEGVDWLYFVLRFTRRLWVGRGPELHITGLESFSDDERRFAEALIRKYVSVAPLVAFRVRIITFLLRFSGVRLIVGIDDARYYHELAAAARSLSIPFFVYQHGSGHYTPYHVGWLSDQRLLGERMYPDDVVVWNEYWKQELLDLGAVWDASRIHVGGNAKKEGVHAIGKGTPRDPVLIPYETDASPELVRDAMNALGELGIPIVFKLRPDVPEDVQKKVVNEVRAHVTCVTHDTVEVSAVVGLYTTVLYEAVSAGVPAGVLESPIPYSKRLVKNGLCNHVSLLTIREDIEALRNLSAEEIMKRKVAASVGPFEPMFESILKGAGIV